MVEPETEVQVVGQVAPKVMEGRGARLPSEVEEAVTPHRVESLHPGAEEPSLACWFVVTLPDAGEAEAIVSRLRALPDVEAAYVEPPSAAPG